VRLPTPAAMEVQLRDLTGQLTMLVPLAGLPTGTYVVQLRTATGTATCRITKE